MLNIKSTTAVILVIISALKLKSTTTIRFNFGIKEIK